MKPQEQDIEQYLTFILGNEEYGVNILSVQEIRGWTPATPIPNSPDYVLGVVNLRGLAPGQSLQVAQQNHLPVLDAQARERTLELFAALRSDGERLRIFRAPPGGSAERIQIRRFLGAHRRLLASPKCRVPRHGQQPGTQRRLSAETARVPHQRYEDVLQHVLDVGDLPSQFVENHAIKVFEFDHSYDLVRDVSCGCQSSSHGLHCSFID